jgi:Zn-dependent protease
VNTHFSVFRVPVHVQPYFWLMAAFFGFSLHGPAHGASFSNWLSHGQAPSFALWFPIMFLAILLHELGHAIVGRAFGATPMVILTGWGGLTQLHGPRIPAGRSAVVSFAGPLVGLVIGSAAWCIQAFARLPQVPVLYIALDDIVFTNFVWALFNLVPIVGLDGGNIMSSILEKIFGLGGVRSAHVISIFVAVGLATLALVVSRATGAPPPIWILLIFGVLAMNNYRAWQAQGRWVDKLRPQGGVARPAPPPAAPVPDAAIGAAIERGWRAVEDRNAAMVRMIAESLAPRVRSDEHRVQVAHLLAWGRLLSGDATGARRALEMLPAGQLPDALLDGAILLETGSASEAVAPLTEAIVGRSDDFVAMKLARAVVASGDVAPLIALLGREEDAKEATARPFQVVVGELSHANRHEEARALGEALFARFHKGADAFNVACALGRLGRADEALAWLEKSLDAGLPDKTVLDTDQDLAALRDLPGFDAIREKARSL